MVHFSTIQIPHIHVPITTMEIEDKFFLEQMVTPKMHRLIHASIIDVLNFPTTCSLKYRFELIESSLIN